VEKFNIHTLVGKKNVKVALKCLPSACSNVEESKKIIVHEDGSLNEKEVSKIKEKLPVEKVLGREEADNRVREKLKLYPRCQEYREKSNFALKLFDVPLLASENQVVYLDSDILFMKPVKELFHLQDESARFSSNGHMGNAYAVAFTQVEPMGSLRLVDSLNSGLFCIERTHFDLDFIEYVLEYLSGSERYRQRPYWAEQTCWSALAAKIGVRLWSFEDITIPRTKSDGSIHVPESASVVHFASSVRDALWRTEVQPGREPSRVKLESPDYNTSMRQLKFDLDIYAESILNKLSQFVSR